MNIDTLSWLLNGAYSNNGQFGQHKGSNWWTIVLSLQAVDATPGDKWVSNPAFSAPKQESERKFRRSANNAFKTLTRIAGPHK